MKAILRERQGARERAKAWIQFVVTVKYFLRVKQQVATVYEVYKREALRQRSARRLQIFFLEGMRAKAFNIATRQIDFDPPQLKISFTKSTSKTRAHDINLHTIDFVER